MSDTATVPAVDMEKLTKVYIKMRDAKAAIQKEMDAKLAAIDEQMDTIEGTMLEVLKATGNTGARNAYGTITRKTKTRIWTSDADSFRKFVRENDAIELFEMRIAQKNMAQWIAENPDKAHPPGLVVDSRYVIEVRRATPASE